MPLLPTAGVFQVYEATEKNRLHGLYVCMWGGVGGERGRKGENERESEREREREIER